MKLSACMMVKNEEHFLPQALTSIKDIVDEIIVVDTGSTDSTIEIAKAFGAKVFNSPWRDDFSYHRNESISYATGDWVLIIDADEKLVTTTEFKNKNGLKNWIQQVDKEYNTIALVVKDYDKESLTMSCNSARLFRKGCIHYEHRVHNAPIFEGAAVLCPQMFLEHYGYSLSKEKMKAKFHRTRDLLMKELEDLDEDGYPKNQDVYFYLCQLYGHHKKESESRKWGYKYLEMRDRIDPDKYNLTIYYTMIKSCQDSGLLDEAYRLIKEISREKPFDPDIASALADHGAMTDNLYIMAEGCRRYIKGYREMMENPAKKAGQFYFSLRDDILVLNLYRLSIASLQEGVEVWAHLKPRLEQHASESILKELRHNLTKIGMTHLLNDLTHLYNDLPQESDASKLDVFKIPI